MTEIKHREWFRLSPMSWLNAGQGHNALSNYKLSPVAVFIVALFLAGISVNAPNMSVANAQERSIEIEEFKHRGCAVTNHLGSTYSILPMYAHVGRSIHSGAFEPSSDLDGWAAVHRCNSYLIKKQLSCEKAIQFEGHVLPQNRVECRDAFRNEVVQCKAHYKQQKPKCAALRTDKTAKVQKRQEQKKPASVNSSSGASRSTNQSPWEELTPDDSPSPGWEELQGEQERKRLIQQRRQQERKRLIQQRREQERQRLADQQRREQERQWLADQQRREQERQRRAQLQRERERQRRAQLQRERERQAHAQGQGGADAVQSFLTGFTTGFAIVKELDELLGQGGGSPGFVGQGAGSGPVTGACQQAQVQAARRLNSQSVSGGGSQCSIRRSYAQMLQAVRQELAGAGCSASALQEYDRAIAETRRQARMVCN